VNEIAERVNQQNNWINDLVIYPAISPWMKINDKLNLPI
jgi:hypothetical protein